MQQRIRNPWLVSVKHLALILLSVSAGTVCAQSAGTDPGQHAAEPVANEQAATDTHQHGEPKDEVCIKTAPSEELVDRIRARTHSNMCKTAAWLDGLFGDDHKFDDSKFTGKISIGFREDETEGFDPRVRVRIRTKLPNASSRFNAFFGRVEEDSYISDTEVNDDRINTVGLRSTNDDDDEWLFGLGYARPNSKRNGFDYSVGAKLSGGFNPYAKIRHRHLFEPRGKNYWRTTQTAFWRRDEKLGFSSQLDYTRIMGDYDILEWDTSAKYTEEAEQWEWLSSTSWHHSFSRTRGISSRIYVRGEEKNEVDIPEYGVSFTYIREFLRPWLFIETGVDFRWEKHEPNKNYKSATRFALQLEMLMGDYYRKQKK